MKNFKFCIAYLAIFAMIFTSCSKDEVGIQDIPSTEMATLSFGAVLNDFVANRAALKAPLTGDVPACSDAAPVKVRIALKDGGGIWVAGKDGDAGGFIEIPVIPNGEGGWMTKESADLELPEGMYSLEYFAVLDAGNNILWIAPRENDMYGPANFAAFVNDALPIAINLRLGVKKYIDVEVLCYDQRFADEFGYLFFDFTEVDTITLCLFGNYCNEIGRHFPAKFSVEAWMYSGDPLNPKGAALTNEALFNETGLYQDPTEAFAKPLCIVLPDRAGSDSYYIEISTLDFDGVYDAPAGLKQTLVISDTEVKALYNNGTNTYYHFREGCGDDNGNGGGNGECDPLNPNADCNDNQIPNRCDPAAANYATFDCDGDEILNGVDECPNQSGLAEFNGCPDPGNGGACTIDTPNTGCSVANFEGATGFVQITENLPFELMVNGNVAGNVSVVISGGSLTILSQLSVAYLYTDYEIEVSANSAGTNSITMCGSPDFAGVLDIDFGNIAASYPYYVRMKANVCPAAP